jgi:hypothetical protein
MRWTRAAADEQCGMRTAKSCGPDIPVLMSAQCVQRIVAKTGAIKPVPGEITYKVLKPARGECRLIG